MKSGRRHMEHVGGTWRTPRADGREPAAIVIHVTDSHAPGDGWSWRAGSRSGNAATYEDACRAAERALDAAGDNGGTT